MNPSVLNKLYKELNMAKFCFSWLDEAVWWYQTSDRNRTWHPPTPLLSAVDACRASLPLLSAGTQQNDFQ